jgi:enoyl-[acyl-carrier protein] reductase I
MSNNILIGKKGLIFGALNEESIAWQIATKCHEEGATFVLTNKPSSIRLGKLNELAETTNSKIIPAEITDTEDLKRLITETLNHLDGKIDFVLHSVGMSRNIRKNTPYDILSYEHLTETLDISAISLHKLVQMLISLDALNENASIIAMTYVASQRTFHGYTDMSDAKALLESITRNFGVHLGEYKKVRINAISQSPTPSAAGSGINNFSDFYDYAELMSPLGNATAAECAEFCAMMFSDYTRKVTMQTLYHDGGFSSVGLSERIAKLLPHQDKTSI